MAGLATTDFCQCYIDKNLSTFILFCNVRAQCLCLIFSLERRDSTSSKTVIFLDQEDDLEDAYYPREGSDIDEEDDSDTEGESMRVSSQTPPRPSDEFISFLVK